MTSCRRNESGGDGGAAPPWPVYQPDMAREHVKITNNIDKETPPVGKPIRADRRCMANIMEKRRAQVGLYLSLYQNTQTRATVAIGSKMTLLNLPAHFSHEHEVDI